MVSAGKYPKVIQGNHTVLVQQDSLFEIIVAVLNQLAFISEQRNGVDLLTVVSEEELIVSSLSADGTNVGKVYSIKSCSKIAR